MRLLGTTVLALLALTSVHAEDCVRAKPLPKLMVLKPKPCNCTSIPKAKQQQAKQVKVVKRAAKPSLPPCVDPPATTPPPPTERVLLTEAPPVAAEQPTARVLRVTQPNPPEPTFEATVAAPVVPPPPTPDPTLDGYGPTPPWPTFTYSPPAGFVIPLVLTAPVPEPYIRVLLLLGLVLVGCISAHRNRK